MWTVGCSGTTNFELVKNLRENEIIKSENVFAAMRSTDRAFYVPEVDPSMKVSKKYKYGDSITASSNHTRLN